MSLYDKGYFKLDNELYWDVGQPTNQIKTCQIDFLDDRKYKFLNSILNDYKSEKVSRSKIILTILDQYIDYFVKFINECLRLRNIFQVFLFWLFIIA